MCKRTASIIQYTLFFVGLCVMHHDSLAQTTQTLYCPDQGDTLWFQINLIQKDAQETRIFEKKYETLASLVEDTALKNLDIGIMMIRSWEREDCFQILRKQIESRTHITEQVKAVQIVYQVKDNRLTTQYSMKSGDIETSTGQPDQR